MKTYIKRAVIVLSILTFFSLPPAWASAPKVILSLGNDTYIPREEVERATGAIVQGELKGLKLTEVSVVILSDISYASLPPEVQSGLVEFVEKGGSLLITGGSQSFGSGGYRETDLAALLPLTPLPGDWRIHPFAAPVPLQPGHPALAEIGLPVVANFNDTNPAPGATVIAQYPRRGLPPLMAEKGTRAGTVFAIALDLAELSRGGWPDESKFVLNLLTYLLGRSRLGPPALKK
ncbi:MAG: hypothetical protein HY998_04155 [candidate division NC10 bacterium]|nr:hypothetical protein [candidate division NC10 bacterium]